MTISYIFDTYAKISIGRIIHFRVVLDDKDTVKALAFARSWLRSIGEEQATTNQHNCIFFHSTKVSADSRKQIDEQGYVIFKLDVTPS